MNKRHPRCRWLNLPRNDVSSMNIRLSRRSATARYVFADICHRMMTVELMIAETVSLGCEALGDDEVVSKGSGAKKKQPLAQVLAQVLAQLLA